MRRARARPARRRETRRRAAVALTGGAIGSAVAGRDLVIVVDDGCRDRVLGATTLTRSLRTSRRSPHEITKAFRRARPCSRRRRTPASSRSSSNSPNFERDRSAFAADLVKTGRMDQSRADSIAYYAVRESISTAFRRPWCSA